MSSRTLRQMISRLWHHLNRRRRRQLGVLLVLMIVAAFAEVVSIGAVLPFLGVLTAPEKVFAHPAARPIIEVLDLATPQQLLFPVTVAFALTAFSAGGIRLLLLYTVTRLSFAIGADLSLGIYSRTLYQPYAVHAARNSSDLINGITSKIGIVIYNVLIPCLTLTSSALVLITILAALLMIDPMVAIAAFVGFGSIYWAIIRLTRRQLYVNSERIARESTQLIKSLQEGLGGIRDVLIDGSQATYCEIYRRADHPLRLAQGSNQFIAASPRYAMETLGMVLITGLAYVLSQREGGMSTAIPILGALALGAQRLLPVLQQGYQALSSVKGSQASLRDTLELLDQPMPGYAGKLIPAPISFQQGISLHNLAFRYTSQGPWILRGINLNIPKGSRVGFIGQTGCGKSTLLDIIMGLLQPTGGMLCVDGQTITDQNCRAWQAHIAHVPQAIYLADSTIEENIAFGVPKNDIDHDRVRLAAQQAQIADSIETWPKQYQTFVGERGIRLSGGQRQRIGIARALYKQANVIIFDEATSALDNETEQAVMQAIENLSKDLTLLIIAHRVTTLKNCTLIFELEEGEIKRSGRYQDITEQSEYAPKYRQDRFNAN